MKKKPFISLKVIKLNQLMKLLNMILKKILLKNQHLMNQILFIFLLRILKIFHLMIKLFSLSVLIKLSCICLELYF